MSLSDDLSGKRMLDTIRLKLSLLGSRAGVWIAIAGVLVLAQFLSDEFLQIGHLLNVARQVSSLAIVTTGQVFVIITGGLDLSNGMVITLVTVVASSLLDGSDANIGPVVFLCLLIGICVGLFNGILVTRLRIPPLIATLATYGILKGIAYVWTDGAPKGDIPAALIYVGNGYIGGIPVAVICAIGFVAIGAVLLNHTVFGRQVFAVGANRNAARLSGVNVEMIVVLAYVVSGVSAAFAGLVVAGYVGTGSLTVGSTYSLDSIAAAVIGGTALVGGTGSVVSGAAGALFLALVVSLLRFVGLSYSGQLIVQGTILAAAVLVQSRANRER